MPDIPVRGRLIVDPDRGQVFLEIDRLEELVDAVDEFQYLKITDPGQGDVVVREADTNIEARPGSGYIFAGKRRLL